MKVTLSDDGMTFRADAHYQILSHLYYPKCEASRAQAVFLMQSEAERYNSLGTNWKPSDLSKTLMVTLQKRSGKIALTGLVATMLSLLEYLKHRGLRMTLHRAASIIDAYVEDNPDAGFIIFSNGQPTDKAFPLSLGTNEISKVFREFRSVAHICAAQNAVAEYFDTVPMMGWGPEAIGCYAVTVADFQAHLLRAENGQGHELVDVLGSLPVAARDYLPLRPSQDVIDALLTPAISKGRLPDLRPSEAKSV